LDALSSLISILPQIIAALAAPTISYFVLPILPKLTARKENLHKLSLVSKKFSEFFNSELRIKLNDKNKKRDLLISMPFVSIGYLLVLLSLFIPSIYYIYLVFLMIIITCVPLCLNLFLEKRYKNEEDKSIVEYLITKDEKIILWTQVYSMMIPIILAVGHQQTQLFIDLFEAFIGLIIIWLIRVNVFPSFNSVYDRVFKAHFKSKLYVKVITEYKEINGRILGIGNYLIIEDEKGAKWPIDWHSIKDIALIKEK